MESQELEQKLNKEEYQKWKKFKEIKSSQINKYEQELIASLHSKYFYHNFYIPCGCSPKVWNIWIKDLNILYERGFRNNK